MGHSLESWNWWSLSVPSNSEHSVWFVWVTDPKVLSHICFGSTLLTGLVSHVYRRRHVFFGHNASLPNVILKVSLQESVIANGLLHFHQHYTIIPPMLLCHGKIPQCLLQPSWGLLCILNGKINVSKPVLCNDLHSTNPLDISAHWFPVAASSAPSLALVQTCFQVSCLINYCHLTWDRIFDTDLKMPPVALP